MAPSPTIPTSFVPKQPVRSTTRPTKSAMNVFMASAVVILAVAVVGSAAVFGYKQYLKSVRDSKAEAVATAEQTINQDGVKGFVRTRDRLVVAKSLLDSHIASSHFFELLEARTLQSVRFNTLSFAVGPNNIATIHMEGTARSFNALAAQSSLLASESKIRRAIFSGINVNPNDTVVFSLTAELDPSLIAFSAADAPVLPTEPGSASSTEASSTPPTETL